MKISPSMSTILAGTGALGLMAVSPDAHARIGMPMAISSYYDASRSLRQLFFLDGQGGIDVASFTDGVSGAWSCTQVLPSCTVAYNVGTPLGCTSLNTAEFAPGGNLVATFDGSTGHLYYIGNDAKLWEAWGNPPSSANVHSLTVASGASSVPYSQWSTCESFWLPGSTMPCLNPAATLAAYDVSPSDQHIFFRGLSDGRLHETYYNGTWHDRLLPATTNMSNALSGIGETAFWDGSVGHVFFEDQSSSVNEFYWYNNNWWGGLSAGNGPSSPRYFLAGLASSTGGTFHESVYGSSSTAGVIAQASCTSGACWTESTITPPGGQVWGSPMLAFSSPTQDWVFYVGGDNNIYSSQAGAPINVSAGAPAVGQSGTPVHQSPLTGFWDAKIGYALVFYVGPDSHVYQLFASSPTGPWYYTDLTSNGRCNQAAAM
jgi:hypothetical protein